MPKMRCGMPSSKGITPSSANTATRWRPGWRKTPALLLVLLARSTARLMARSLHIMAIGPLAARPRPPETCPVTQTSPAPAPAAGGAAVPGRRTRPHRAWAVAAAAFLSLIGAAGFASLPGLLIDPLHSEFG